MQCSASAGLSTKHSATFTAQDQVTNGSQSLKIALAKLDYRSCTKCNVKMDKADMQNHMGRHLLHEKYLFDVPVVQVQICFFFMFLA